MDFVDPPVDFCGLATARKRGDPDHHSWEGFDAQIGIRPARAKLIR